MKMNRRATISVIVWIVLAIVGLFVANQLGFFAIFIPDVGQPTGTDSLVNPVHYPAINDPNYPCTSETKTYFRATFDLNSEITVSTGDYFAYTLLDPPGTNLGRHLKTSGNILTSQSDSCLSDYGAPIITAGKFSVYSSFICQDRADGKHNRRGTSTSVSSSPLSTSTSVQGGNELTVTNNVQDTGTFACRDGDVVMQYCGTFGFLLEQDCPAIQPCQFFPSWNVPGIGLQPSTKCGTLIQSYFSNQKLCADVGPVDGTPETLYETNVDGTSISTTVCDLICDGNAFACIDCNSGDKRCAQLPGTTTDIETCIGGSWVQWTNPGATCIGEETCVAGVCTSEFFDGQKRCSGLQPEVYDGGTETWGNDGEVCDIQCNEISSTNVDCENECEIGFICGAGYLEECQALDRDNERVAIGNCVSGSCEDPSHCAPVRELEDIYCIGNDLYRGINSGNPFDIYGGVTGGFIKTCANSCSPISSTKAECTKAIGCGGKAGLSICLDSFTRKVCSQDEETYVSSEDCTQTFTNGFCELAQGVGVCRAPTSQCSGTQFCFSDVEIRECNSGTMGPIIDDCNGFGCFTDNNGNPDCNDECSSFGDFSCIGGDSYQCILEEVAINQLLLNLVQVCGSEGCDTQTGSCILSGTPDSYTCIGEDRSGDGRGDDIWYIDSKGFLDHLVTQCSAGDKSFCSEGDDYCKFCELSSIFCSEDGSQELRCLDDTVSTGIQILDDCEVGCFVQNQVRYCDDLVEVISATQNFLKDEDISIEGLLKGSESQNGVITNLGGKIEIVGGGLSETKSVSSDTNGNFDINFGKKPLGEYLVTITNTEYSKTYTVGVKVTNDFIIELSGSPVLIIVPGTTPSVDLDIRGGDGEPEDIIIVNASNALTSIDVKKETISGRWRLEVDGEAGIYEIKLAAIDGGVQLDTQSVTIELRKPTLTITTNLPESSKPRDLTIDINVEGPVDESGTITTKGIRPDSITATLTPGTLLNLEELGTGGYVFQENFLIGTYVLNVEAFREGYESASISKQIEISLSGDATPSSSSGGGSFGGGENGGTGAGGIDNRTIGIIILILVIYFIFRKK